MAAALVCYTLFNLAILAFIVLFVRATRARAVPNERVDLEENALVAADWERVRRERCLPAGCPRLRGQPPRPRKDVTCEICAATFLEIRLQRFLEGPLAPEPAEPGRGGLTAEAENRSSLPVTSTISQALALRGPTWEPEVRFSGARLRRGTRRSRLAAGRWGRLRFGLGIGCVGIGTVVALFGGTAWLIAPGSLMGVLGLGLILSSAAAGAL